MTEATLLETFTAAHDAFTPEPNDNPDCVPFYRTWHGMRAVLAAADVSIDAYHSAIHECCCWASHLPTVAERYRVALETLQANAARMKMPERPRYMGWYRSEPTEPTMDDARAFFNSEFKRQFAGERANSKHANVLWKEKQQRAMEIVRERHQRALAAYRTEYEAHQQREQALLAEWQAKCDAVRAFQAEVSKLAV